jgi:hypothetical protein
MIETFGRSRISAALMAVVVAAACGGGDDTGGAPRGGGGPVESPVDASTAGSISGQVMFMGMAPAPEPIDMRDEPQCAEKHSSPPVRERVKVSNGGLENVFVYVKSGPVTEMRFPTPSEAQVLDQDGCMYLPHVIGLQTGQTLTVRNSDPLMHNVNASPRENRPFNFSQPQEGMETNRTLANAEVMIPVRCDVHGWMESFIGVTSHPYHAVTADGGTFSLENLPPGEYEIEAWHERYGTQTQTVTVPASGEAEVMFHFDDTMTGRVVPMGAPLFIDHETGEFRRGPSPAAHAHTGNQ